MAKLIIGIFSILVAIIVAVIYAQVFIVIVLVLILACLISYFINANRRRKLKKVYNIDFIPKDFKIKKNRTDKDGEYELNGPSWLYSNKDGSKNRVRKDNRLIYYNSTLYFKEYEICTTSPIDMVKLVHEFRNKFGIDIIKKNIQELNKYNYLIKRNKMIQKNNTIQAIIDEFRDTPSEFENFCAILFEKMGYEVEVTPKVNDGGYDLILEKDNLTSIVECKCYAMSNSIGRPLIQKLVGANQYFKADKMFFITTSYFTKEAINYAEDVNVELIDGRKLIDLNNKFANKNLEKIDTVGIDEWELNETEVLYLYPPDCR